MEQETGDVKKAFILLPEMQYVLCDSVLGDCYAFPSDVCRNVYPQTQLWQNLHRERLEFIWLFVSVWYSDGVPDWTFGALGNAKSSILVAVMRKFILLIPLIYIMPMVLSGDKTMAVYMAEPVADVLAITFYRSFVLLPVPKGYDRDEAERKEINNYQIILYQVICSASGRQFDRLAARRLSDLLIFISAELL